MNSGKTDEHREGDVTLSRTGWRAAMASGVDA